MAYKEREIERVYWTISEVANMFNTSASAIRYWSDYFKLELHRTKSGGRLYNKEAIKSIAVIRYLLLIEGFTLKGAMEKLYLWRWGKFKVPEKHLEVKEVDDVKS